MYDRLGAFHLIRDVYIKERALCLTEITGGVRNTETVVAKSSFIWQQITVILLHTYENLEFLVKTEKETPSTCKYQPM